MTPDDKKRIEDIEARVNALPLGEWKHCAAQDGQCPCGVVWNKGVDIPVCVVADPSDEAGGWPPAVRVALSYFITHSRADTPWLIAKIREQEKSA